MKKQSSCHPDRLHYAKGLCRSCYSRAGYARWQRTWRLNNPDRNLQNWLNFKYGISLFQYKTMLAKQGFKCAVCMEDAPIELVGTYQSRRLSVDHNHTTGKVRGLLCIRCNSFIGFARDCPEVLQKAIDYLTVPD